MFAHLWLPIARCDRNVGRQGQHGGRQKRGLRRESARWQSTDYRRPWPHWIDEYSRDICRRRIFFRGRWHGGRPPTALLRPPRGRPDPGGGGGPPNLGG